MKIKYRVRIVETATGNVVKSFPASSRRQAERLEDGVSINLNHAEFHTVINEVQP